MSAEKRCRDVANMVPKFLDGELTRQEEQAVKSELAECASCRAHYERLQKLRALVREVYVEEARTADLDGVLPGVMAKIANRSLTWRERLTDWLDRYRLGLASPVAPLGVAATLAVGVIAATLIYASSAGPDGAPAGPVTAPQLALSQGADVRADSGNESLSAQATAQNKTPRRPAHDETPFMKNEAMITYYNAESGIVIVDVDPDGEAPAVVWHFPDEGGAVKEGSRI